MSDFKFSCPACGQRMLAGLNYQGLRIQCPACQTSITVPTRPAAQITPAPEPKPMQPAPEQPTVKPQPPTSGLARASLALSVSSVVIGPFGFIPGIMCGHLAKRQLRREPLLRGTGLASVGLWVGYGFFALGVAVLGILFATGLAPGRPGQTESPTGGTPASSASSAARLDRQPPAAATMHQASEEENDGWKSDLNGVMIPGEPLNGRMRGQRFVCDRAEVSPSATPRFLTLQQGEGLQGDLKITIIIPDREGLEGRKISFPKASDLPTEGDYRVAILWQENGQYHSRQFTRAVDGFALRLESDPRSRKRLKGRIYLCLGDEQKSYVAGTFDAKVE